MYTLRHRAASHLRGRLPLEDFRAAAATFESACAGVARDTVMAGGAIGELVHACREIAAEAIGASVAGGRAR